MAAGAGPGGQAGSSTVSGLPQPVTGDSSVPVGKGETAMGSLTTADGQDVGIWLKGQAGGQQDSPIPRVTHRTVPAGLSHWDARAGRTQVTHLSSFGGSLCPEQAFPRDGLMAFPPLGKPGGADEWEGFFYFLFDFSLSTASSAFIHQPV